METVFAIVLICFSPFLLAFELCCITILVGALFYKIADSKRYKTISIFNTRNIVVSILGPLLITAALVVSESSKLKYLEAASVLMTFQSALLLLALITLGSAIFFKLLFKVFDL